MNTDFIPELDHEEFVLQQQPDLGSPDVVSLSEGLSTSDGPTYPRACSGKDKLNRILKVSILLPYLLLNTVFSVRSNQF